MLLTNATLAGRSGTELYVRDVATALLRAGHRPVVYSPRLGPLADELRRATVPTVDDLESVGVTPDVIHAHHALESLTALLRFPQTPAVFVCHDWSAWHDEPPRLDRVRRYIAVDDTCRDRLVGQCGIAAGRISVLQNAVDLARFLPREVSLPPRPRRALVMSNYVQRDAVLANIRAACDRRDIALDAVGLRMSGACDAPEHMLGGYDLVFAKGRCALEAMASGAAVIVCDRTGMGPMVTSADFPRLRRWNFGRRLLQQPVRTPTVVGEIDRYDAADAARVSKIVRDTAGLDPLVARLVGVYRDAIDEHRAATAETMPDVAAEIAAEYRAIARHLRWWAVTWEPLLREEALRYRRAGLIARLGRSLGKRAVAI
ncbi:MAG: glycosyltransferase [Pirellulales bacterium]